MKISSALEKIDEKQIFVPAFQREYVWKREDAKKLLDALIKDYPVGTLLTWETNNPPELKGKHKYDKMQGAVKLLLDGQQRITTLYMLVNGELPPYYKVSEIMNDVRGLFVNLKTLELSYFMKNKMTNEPLWQNVTDIFQKSLTAFDIVSLIEDKMGGDRLDREDQVIISQNISKIEKILDRDFPEQTIPAKAKIKEAIDIFYTVNASGVSLTDAELALAQISGYWAEARDLFKAKLEDLKKQGFPLKLDFIVSVLLGCMYHSGSEMQKLHADSNREKLIETWKLLDEKILDYVFNIIRSKAYVDHTKEMGSPYSLIPFIVYSFENDGRALTDDEIKKFVKWFYYSQLRTRYTSQLKQKLDRDLKVLIESKQPFDDLLSVIEEDSRLEILPTEFVGRGIQHPLFAIMRWYFKSKGAVCLTTGMSIHQNMGKKYQLEYDHIFPYSKLKKAGYNQDNRNKYALAQEITNRAVLTQTANREKSDTPACDYLKSAQKQFPEGLKLQVIPEDQTLWDMEKYETFLQLRREMLAKELNEFLENITETFAPQLSVDIIDLINRGESGELEFKSSLRWCYQNEEENKKLEEVIIKTIAAFGNSYDGGTLLIGVSDDGEVLGLENDYTLLNGDKDKFEMHLRNIISNHYDGNFSSSRVSISFNEVDLKEICRIDISPASKLLVFNAKDKHGKLNEVVYRRDGNQSSIVPTSELQDFIQDRFAY